ncbi:MAG: thiol reductant ABC exporter subunit CydD [Ignavibacteriae bacterium]|nr:thiol reductant ABC exporter subunit CydD [Ignavibacteriota bacterium]
MQFNKRLFKLTFQAKYVFILTILFGVISAVSAIIQAYFLSDIIDKVFLKKFNLAGVQLFIVIIVIVSVIKSVFLLLEQNYANKISSYIKMKLRERISKHIFELGPTFLKSERSGEISNTLINGVERLDAYFSQFLPQLFFSAFIPIIILVIVFQIDILSTVVFIVTAPLIPIFMVLIGSISDQLNKKQWKNLSLMSAFFLDVIQGLYTIKIFGKTKHIINKIKLVSQSFKNSSMKVLRVAFLSALVLEVLSTISIAIIAVEIGLRLLSGNIEFQPALFILILAPDFYNPIRQLGARYHAGMEGVEAAERIFNILDTPILEFKINKQKIDFLNSNITFENVNFTYNDKQIPAVENLNFTIECNKVTALIGESGSGKTTTTNLLLKFIQPDSGVIKISNHNLADLNRDDWLKNISLISQTPYLFHSSIKENLQIAKENITDEVLISSVKFAKLDKLINKLPNGFETIIGEHGTRLSGGEAQRVAIARAFLKDAPLLILDEPMANLDPTTEAEIFDSIKQLTKNKTVIIVAHRLNTIKSADNFLLFNENKVVAQGKHDELLKSNKYYLELIKKHRGSVD